MFVILFIIWVIVLTEFLINSMLKISIDYPSFLSYLMLFGKIIRKRAKPFVMDRNSDTHGQRYRNRVTRQTSGRRRFRYIKQIEDGGRHGESRELKCWMTLGLLTSRRNALLMSPKFDTSMILIIVNLLHMQSN